MNDYEFLPISIICLVVYLISYFFAKKKVIKYVNHRRVWNLLLLISFLIAGNSGFVMAFLHSINSDSVISDFLMKLHVNIGIAWFIIALFHVLWHLSYFKKTLKILFSRNRLKTRYH